MPTRAPVFTPRCVTAPMLGYDQTTRKTDPALARAKQLRSSGRWRAVRALVLGQAPLCADPYSLHAATGQAVLATEVDHIVGLRDAPLLAFTLSNLQGLCAQCHARKSQAERRAQQ